MKGKGKSTYDNRQTQSGKGKNQSKGRKGKGRGGQRSGYATPATTEPELSDTATLREGEQSVEEWEPEDETYQTASSMNDYLQRSLNEYHRRNSQPLWCTNHYRGQCDGNCGLPHLPEETTRELQERRAYIRSQGERIQPPTRSASSTYDEEY